MEIKIAKYGNLMGSPDVKAMMHSAGAGTPEADELFDDVYHLKLDFGMDGRSTSAILIEPDCPRYFPALIDFSFLCADPASHNEGSVRAALESIAEAGLSPEMIKSVLVTHPHGDHFDPRLLPALKNAKVYADVRSRIPATLPMPEDFSESVVSVDTPGHGVPHCSYIVDLPRKNLVVCFAGDLIMSHAHYLAMDRPLNFSDHVAGKKSVDRILDVLRSRSSKYRMIIPGHDIPFFV